MYLYGSHFTSTQEIACFPNSRYKRALISQTEQYLKAESLINDYFTAEDSNNATTLDSRIIQEPSFGLTEEESRTMFRLISPRNLPNRFPSRSKH